MAMTEKERANYREMRDCLKGLIRSLRILVTAGKGLIGEAEELLQDAEARKGRW